MTLVVPQDFASVVQTFIWTGDPEPMAITYGVGIDTGSPPASVTDLAEDLRDAFDTAMLPSIDGILSMGQTEVSWQDSAPPTPPLIGVAAGGGSGGGTAGSVLPQNSAFLVHKRTALGGRGGRGRLYVPGVDESVCSDLGAITSTWQNTFNTALAAWLTAIVGIVGVTNMVLFHDDGGAYAAETPYQVVSLTLDPNIATQRRRLRH